MRAPRSRFVIGMGALLAGAVAGCGGSSSDASDTPASSPELDGRYVAVDPGDIAAIEFHSPNYALTPTTCTTASCVDVGTYTLDSAAGTITLRTSSTGAERTLPFVVLDAQPRLTSATASVEVNGLEARGNLVQQPAQPVTKPTPGRLVTAEEIVRALLGNQNVVSDPGQTTSTGTGGNAPAPGK
jgi:hypothetical protein